MRPLDLAALGLIHCSTATPISTLDSIQGFAKYNNVVLLKRMKSIILLSPNIYIRTEKRRITLIDSFRVFNLMVHSFFIFV